MTDEIPRRLRRFYRGEKPTEEEVKHKSAEIAVKEVDKFREANQRYPNRQEIDLISENVFEQLKREISSEEPVQEGSGSEPGRKKKTVLELRREHRMQAAQMAVGKGKTGSDAAAMEEKKKTRPLDEPEKEQETGEEKDDELEQVGELLGDEDTGELGDDVNVARLAELEELSGLEKELTDDNSDLVEKEIDSDLNVCPNCGNRTQELLYCPNCGEAFCDHCAKAVDVQADAVKYTCPKCGKDFRKAKQGK